MSDVRELFEAIRAGELDRVRELVAADPSLARARQEAGPSALMTACYQQRRDMVEVLRAAGPELDLFEAAALGDAERAAALLEEEPESVEAWSPDGFTALHLAAFFGQQVTAGLLLRRGASTSAAARNPSKVQPLHSAAASRSAAMVALLLQHGCDVDARQAGGFTALHSAAHAGNGEMADALLRHGADPAVRTDDGKSAADLAREAGHADLAARLGG